MKFFLLILFLFIGTYSQAQQWQPEDTFAFAKIYLKYPDNKDYNGNIELISAKYGKKYTATLTKGFAKVKLPYNDTYTVKCQGNINYKKLIISNYPYTTHEFISVTHRVAYVNFHYQNPSGQGLEGEVISAKALNKDTTYTATTNKNGDAKLIVLFEDAYSLSVKYRPDFEVIRARELGQPYTTINVKLVWKGSVALERERAISDSLLIEEGKKLQLWLIQREKDRIQDSIHHAIALLSDEVIYFEKILKLNDSKVIDLRNEKVPFSKEVVAADFKKNLVDKAINQAKLGWTGDGKGCKAGVISAESKAIFLAQINFFRRMAGVSDNVFWSEEKNTHCQECALMCYSNYEINHHPPSSWSCYSQSGASACGYSNLSMGSIDWPLGHVAMYMNDFGEDNYSVGHRRWLINPHSNEMGIGATPNGTAIAVFPNYDKPSNPKTRDEFVAWPPRGYVPEELIYARWSFGAIDAHLDDAIVEMFDKNGKKIKLKVLTLAYGYAIPTIVWEPAFQKMKKGERYEVTISNVKVQGQRYMYRYWVEAI